MISYKLTTRIAVICVLTAMIGLRAAAQTVAITGGKVKPAQAIPVNLKLTGPAWSPSVSDLDLKPAVSQIVKEGGAALVGKALGVDSSKAEEAAKKKAEAVQQEAQKKVQDEAAKRLKGLFGGH